MYNAQLDAVHHFIEQEEKKEAKLDSASISGHVPFTLLTDPNVPALPMTAEAAHLLGEQVTLAVRSVYAAEAKKSAKSAAPATQEQVPINMANFENALKTMRASVSAAERKRYERIYAEFIASKGEEFVSHANKEQKQTLA